MKKRFLVPMIAAMSMAMVVPAFAGQIYVGDTETVVSYDENGNKVITMIFDPAKTPDFFKEQYITPPQPTKTAGEERIRAEPLREAPEVGAVPMHMVCSRTVPGSAWHCTAAVRECKGMDRKRMVQR